MISTELHIIKKEEQITKQITGSKDQISAVSLFSLWGKKEKKACKPKTKKLFSSRTSYENYFELNIIDWLGSLGRTLPP